MLVEIGTLAESWMEQEGERLPRPKRTPGVDLDWQTQTHVSHQLRLLDVDVVLRSVDQGLGLGGPTHARQTRTLVPLG